VTGEPEYYMNACLRNSS